MAMIKSSESNLTDILIDRSDSSYSKHSVSSESSSNLNSNKTSLSPCQQIILLIHKNIILTFKNLKNLIFLIITPFLLSAFLYLFQDLARANGSRILKDPIEKPIPPFPKCIGSNCVSLDYRLMSTNYDTKLPPWVQYTLDYIKLQTGMNNHDFRTGDTITNFTELEDYYNFQYNHINTTQIGIIFCSGENLDDIVLSTLYCNGTTNYTYFIALNKSDSLTVIFYDYLEPLPIDNVAVSLKILIDSAIVSFSHKKPLPERMTPFKYWRSQYPVAQNKFLDNYDIVTTIGAFYYLITPLFAFLFIQGEIVRQKQMRLRQGLNIAGASHGSYWISWFVVSIIYALVVSFSTYTAGFVFGFGFFTDTPIIIIVFCLMFPFVLSMQLMAYWLSSLSPTLKAANTIGYGVMLFAIVVESFVSDNFLLTFLFSQDPNNIVIFLKYFLCLYPPFSYTKIFTNITQYSGFHFDFAKRQWISSSQTYNYSLFVESIRSKLPFGGGFYYRYSDLSSMLILYGDVVFFLILTWYFDHIIASNRGRADPLYFPFQKCLNLFKKPKFHQKVQINIAISPYNLNEEEQSAIKQRNKVYQNSANGSPVPGLRIKNLFKTFSGNCSSGQVQAIKNLNLQIEGEELLGVLGHNGAGKTTLINILTGVLDPDESQGLQITIDNYPIEKMGEIRKHIGVCSQFDVLWDQLTAEQHLYMFARLKNIPVPEINRKIDQVLSFVSLSNQKKNRVGSFSGGMKRRLSLAIAAVGDPKIILLDEPTSGLDPKVRQQVWHLIEKLKKGKSMILTTHSMQEADILADRICVISKGKLKCIGSSFYLKKIYGEGHRININLKSSSDEDNVVEKIQKFFPTAKKIDCRGGNLILGIQDYQQLINLVKKLESKQSLGLDEYQLKKSIKAWAVSHTTLEEVFMKVSKEKDE